MGDELTPEARAEVQAAAAIIRRDFGKAAFKSVLEEYGFAPKAKDEDPPEDPPEGEAPGKNKAPPPKEKSEDPPEGEPKRKGLFWNPEAYS